MFANRFLNTVIVFYSVEKRFYSVANLASEQDKTHEFSQRLIVALIEVEFISQRNNQTYVHFCSFFKKKGTFFL